jgi:hypothetical protein
MWQHYEFFTISDPDHSSFFYVSSWGLAPGLLKGFDEDDHSGGLRAALRAPRIAAARTPMISEM